MFNESASATLEPMTDSNNQANAGGRKGARKAVSPTVKIDPPKHDRAHTLDALHSAEQVSLMVENLYKQLREKGLDLLGDQAWVISLEADRVAEKLGMALGLEVLVG